MVSVPKIDRFQSSPTMGNNPRINMQVRDQSQQISSGTNALAGVLGEADELRVAIEDKTVNELTSVAEQEYLQWNTNELSKLKSYEGDPTDAYAEYDTRATEKYNEILNKRTDLSPRIRERLNANLSRTADKQRVQTLNQRGMQKEVYSNNVYESSLKLKKGSMADNAGLIRKGDPGSYFMLDDTINDITNTISQRAIEKGIGRKLDPKADKWDHIYKDADGNTVKVQLDDAAKVRLNKERSEGLYAAINSMNSSGYSDEAKEALARYEPYLDAKSRVALNNKFKSSDVKNQAFSKISEIEGKSDDEQMRAIESVKDAKLKSEMLNIKDANDRRRENIRQRKVKANYETLAKRVQDKMSSSDPYYGVADLENDPIYKETWDNLDAKSRKAITESVIAPKVTNPDSEAAIQDLFFGNIEDVNVETLSPTDFNTYLSGLSTSDRKKYTNMYNKSKGQTAAGERAILRQASTMLTDQLLLDDHISRDRYGKISGDDELTLIKARNNLIQALDRQPNMSASELNKFVKEFSAAEIKGKVFNPKPVPVFNTQNNKRGNSQTVAPASRKEVVLTRPQLNELKREYYAANKYYPRNNDDKFKNFVEKNKGKYASR